MISTYEDLPDTIDMKSIETHLPSVTTRRGFINYVNKWTSYSVYNSEKFTTEEHASEYPYVRYDDNDFTGTTGNRSGMIQISFNLYIDLIEVMNRLHTHVFSKQFLQKPATEPVDVQQLINEFKQLGD